MHITGENTVKSNAWVYLVVFYAYYWWKHGKEWFSKQVTGENTVNRNACVHFVVFYAYYWWKHGK